VERLEGRDVPGTALTSSTLGGDLGILYQAALAPAAQFQDLVQATQGVAVHAPANLSDAQALPAPVLAGSDNPLVHQQPFQNVLSQGLPGARAPALPGLEAALGKADLVGEGLGSPPPAPPMGTGNLIVNHDFAAGFAGWTVAFPDAFVNAPVPYAGWAAGLGDARNNAQLGTVGNVDVLTQLIVDTPGQGYTLQFDLAIAGASTAPGTVQFMVLYDGVSLFNIVDPAMADPGGSHYSTMMGAVPGSGFDVLQFVERHDPSFFYLTNVSFS
jgi:hypothetical protein